eukprot:1885288-Pleurochrysis_carterae.AAC.1
MKSGGDGDLNSAKLSAGRCFVICGSRRFEGNGPSCGRTNGAPLTALPQPITASKTVTAATATTETTAAVTAAATAVVTAMLLVMRPPTARRRRACRRRWRRPCRSRTTTAMDMRARALARANTSDLMFRWVGTHSFVLAAAIYLNSARHICAISCYGHYIVVDGV